MQLPIPRPVGVFVVIFVTGMLASEFLRWLLPDSPERRRWTPLAVGALVGLVVALYTYLFL